MPKSMSMDIHGTAPEVLVACSDKGVRAAVRDVLAASDGLELFLASDGGAAIGIASANRPLLAFVDLYIAGMGGLEAAMGIRAASPGTTIVMVGVPDRLDHQMIFATGAEVCLGLDPVEVADVARRELHQWLGTPGYATAYPTAATA
ncbi:MAG: response regulator [Actinomycetota bacterium]